MNRFLLLTGIGPTVSRDDALTWIQVVFGIINTITNYTIIITIISVNIISKKSYLQQRYMVPHAVWKMARLFCDQIHDRC